MNESDVGISTALTLQNAGTLVYVTPSGAVKVGPGTVTAAVTVVPVRPRFTTRFSQVPANAGTAMDNAAAKAATQRANIFSPCGRSDAARVADVPGGLASTTPTVVLVARGLR